MDVGHVCLDGNADAVEFCPHGGFQNILAASTYTLQEGDQPTRSGSISLFDVDADNPGLNLFHRVETAGIFDMKWNPVRDGASPLLAQADADGFVRIHDLDFSNGPKVEEITLKERSSIRISSSMCLCLDWNPLATSIAVGLSDGSLSVTSLTESQLSGEIQWKGHEFEVWAASFDTHQPNIVYTGSDDCKFIGWDLRDGSPSMPVFKNSKAHTMGICCIVKNPNDPNTLLTGCYDEKLRVFDVRSISRPVNETSVSLGGGVWRIKYHPFVKDLVLTACMHNGFSIVKVNKENPKVLETYDKHGSLAYGADWQRCKSKKEGKGESNAAVATCSFYDRLLRVWIPENDILI